MNNETDNKKENSFEKFKDFTKKIIAVPKEEIDRREKKYQKARKANRNL